MKLLRILLTVILPLIIINCLFANDTVKCQTYQTITITENGNIDPATAPISKVENTYTLTDNIYGNIIVRCFNSVLDGAGYTLQGNGTGRGIEVANTYNASKVNGYYVTVRNFTVRNYDEAISVFAFWGNILKGVEITANNIADSGVGIALYSYARYTNNTISNNTISGNREGLLFQMAMEDNFGTLVDVNTVKENRILNNQVGIGFGWMYSYYPLINGTYGTSLMPIQVYYNDFIGNSKNVQYWQAMYSPSGNITWDDPALHLGNYWSDYRGTDINNDGIGDTPYVIDSHNKDNYPLMYSIHTYDFNYKPIPSTTPSISLQPTNMPTATPYLPPSNSNAPHLEPMFCLLPISIIAAIIVVAIIMYRRLKINK